MVDITELQARLEKLRRIRAAGVRTTRFGNDEVTYRDDTELAAAIADIERQIAGPGAVSPVSFVNFRSKRGW